MLFHPLVVCALAAVAFRVHASPTLKTGAVEVTFGGKTYINKGLVGFGLIPSDFIENTGDTLGGIGSAVAIQPSSWKDLGNGTYTGTFIVHPDRGYNVETTIDYQARQHTIDFALTPYYDPSPLSFSSAQNTLLLSYRETVLQYERNGFATTGLDSTSFRREANSDPVLPVPASTDRLSLDVEGIVANADGTFWISDEYGPYIYKYSSDGQLEDVIQPPAAILPLDNSGNFYFTSDDDPATGRSANQGQCFEGLTIDAENQILYAMLQSATIQDGGSDKTTSRYTRLLAYDVSASPILVGEWVIPLPQSNKGKTRGSSEILFIGDGVFLSLSRDGDGRGGDEVKSKYKQADLFDISGATDIHGTKYDDPSNPIAVDGELVDDLTPATYASFVDFINDDQLARFGLHNGGDDDQTLIAAKWESLALVPIGDGNDDYFLFTVADNDFISTRGISLGEPFDAGKDVDSQFLVFRVSL